MSRAKKTNTKIQYLILTSARLGHKEILQSLLDNYSIGLGIAQWINELLREHNLILVILMKHKRSRCTYRVERRA